LAAVREAESALLREAATYVLQGAGKKLRALLVLSIVQDISGFPGDNPSALSCAVAAEVVHAASLVHDDLPALDNDDYRRGRPSCHRAFNEATAILVGDLLVGAAFSCVSSSGDLAERRALVCELLARTWTELCVGQQLDLQGIAVPDQRRRMIELKTGSLFGFAAACGAICSGLERERTDELFSWGVRLGVAFQMLDDIDDGECSKDAVATVAGERESLVRELREYLGSTCEYSKTIVGRILNTQREDGTNR
jgi:geranylgeranyl pyrophosphate synthase